MIFREAGVDDVPHVELLLAEFYAKQGGVYGIPIDEQSTIQTIVSTASNGILLVGPTSCAGAIICPFPFNRQARVAQVIFWYFQLHREIRIFDELLIRCRAMGATHVNATSHPPHNRIARYYQRHGLKQVETQLIGRL